MNRLYYAAFYAVRKGVSKSGLPLTLNRFREDMQGFLIMELLVRNLYKEELFWKTGTR